MAGYAPQNGVVSCSVLTPDGKDISLGSISGTGSFTNSRELAYAAAGTYVFSFYSAMTSPYEVVAYIYD